MHLFLILLTNLKSVIEYAPFGVSFTEHQGLCQLLLVSGFAFATLSQCITVHLPSFSPSNPGTHRCEWLCLFNSDTFASV